MARSRGTSSGDLGLATKGEGGMELLSDNFTDYKRYGHAVTKVNNLGPQDLVRLQNAGFVSIYSKYWRWWPVVRRHGVIGLFFTFFRMIKMIIDKIKYKSSYSGWSSWTAGG